MMNFQDLAQPTRMYVPWQNLLHSSSNLRVYELWQQHYAGVYRANVAIDRIPTVSFPKDPTNQALQARYIGEAKFLRALYYFNLVRLYGDVPLITKPNYTAVTAPEYAIARTPSTAVYLQIEQDLKDASTVLPNTYTGTNVGRATKGAALALLSKVYLTKAGFPLKMTQHYADAINYAQQVISVADGGSGSFGYALQTNYANVFLPAAKNNSEHIFSAQFLGGTSSTYLTQGNNQNPRSIRANVPGLAGSWADQVWFYPNPSNSADKYFSVFKLYPTGDKRRDVTFVTAYRSPSNAKLYGDKLPGIVTPTGKLDSIPYFNKTWDPSKTAVTSESGANVAIIRYSDVLLILAEAANEQNDQATALKALNIVRRRAYGDLLHDLAGLSQDDLRTAIYLDRRLEFVFEYQRWFDLVRQRDAGGNNIFVSTLQAVGKANALDKHRLHPIPSAEISVNPLATQNPGY